MFSLEWFMMLQFLCAMLDLSLPSTIYLEQLRHFLCLHLKILKPGKDRLSLVAAHVRDGISTSLSPATAALPCRNSTTLLGRFPSQSLLAFYWIYVIYVKYQ